jgi:hypothetical protein
MDDATAAAIVFIVALAVLIAVGLYIQSLIYRSWGGGDGGSNPPSFPLPAFDSEILDRDKSELTITNTP